MRGVARAASTAYEELAGRGINGRGIPEARTTVTNWQRIFVRKTFYYALACAGEAAPARGIICDRVLDTRARWLRDRGALLILHTELALVATEARSNRKTVGVLSRHRILYKTSAA